MKKIKLNERQKSLLMIIAVFVVVISGTIIYLNRIERINSGELIVQCECNKDK